MPRFFVNDYQIKGQQIEIIGEDVKHIKNVLRKQIKDKIEICNLQNKKTYNCEIIDIQDTIKVNILHELKDSSENVEVDIYQGLPKSDKMELIIQKSVELGVNAIIPTEMKRCVVKLNEKDKNKKIERWHKISESAAKQCGRNIIPEIKEIIPLSNIVTDKYDLIIVCYEEEKENTIKEVLKKSKNSQKIAVIIGPEGGLEKEEVEKLKQNGAKIVTLGKRILRTETVALNVLSIIMYEFL